MRGFDESCLTPVEALTPREIRALRERERESREPDGVRELPERDAEFGEQVGAGREDALGPGAEASVAGRKAWPRRRRMNGGSGRPE